MKAKEYLLQYKRMCIQIEIFEKELEQLREERSAISIDLNGMPHSSNISDKTATLAVQLADIESEIIDWRSAAWSLRMDIINTLNKLKNPKSVQVLHLRYIEDLKWEEIADKLGYTYQWVAGQLHSDALQELEEILEHGRN